jgi:hypothetical protein
MKATGRAALGFRAHTGWAAVVALAGPPAAPRIVAKRRVEMAESFDVGAVYHVSQRLPLDEAEALIRSSEKRFEDLACAAISDLVAELRETDLETVGGAVVSGGERPLPPLESILRSHALVHAAEGELYRAVVVRASERCHIPAAVVSAADLHAHAARAAGLPEAGVLSTLAALGKASGKPWTRDQKESALAAWIALAGGADGG